MNNIVFLFFSLYENASETSAMDNHAIYHCIRSFDIHLNDKITEIYGEFCAFYSFSLNPMMCSKRIMLK